MAALAAAPVAQARGDMAFAFYAGRMTDQDWRKSLTGRADFIDAHLAVAALRRTLWSNPQGRWSFELEGNVGRHWGEQRHWEFNALVSVRRHASLGEDTLATSLAFGAGPSYATRMPAAEVRLDGQSEKLLLYWHLEWTLGPSRSDWEALFRLHHRSAGYGLFGPTGGGNVLTAGIRRFF